MQDKDWLNIALAEMHNGQWFGWKKDYTGNERMAYENIIVHDSSITKPTEAEVNAKIQELKDAETDKKTARTSAINKLKSATYSALTDAEAKALFGSNQMALKFAVNNSLSAVTSLPTAIPTGSMTLLQTQTASSSSTIDFTSNIDSTYDVYCFKFINMHPATNRADLTFNMSSDSGSNYNVTKTTTFFRSFNFENDSNRGLGYLTANDLAQSTGTQILSNFITNEDDSNASGYLYIYNPSSTTFVKHFISNINHSGEDGSGNNYSYQSFTAGYGNTTSAINAVRFQMSSGNIDSGDIKLYGIS